MSEMLKKARAYEAEKAAQTDKNTRPLFHISAPAGWINDPNGFSVYDGKIHLFYQYYPYAREWGPMHWGHSVTTDMISWEQLPAALAPDQDYDRNGCFSGSAIEADNKHVLVYTGVTKITLPDGREEERQNQCIAFGDGRDYVKYENNPVVTGEMLPENCSRIDFRDPKIWKEEDTYYLIVGSKDNRQIGQVVLCSSKDLKEWKFETVLAANSTGKVGTMWECPDFFPLGDKHVLICSPQNMKAEKYEFHNGNNSVYFLGNYDKNSHIFEKEEPHTIDYGLDFYAPQTTLLPDGRRVMIAWMKSWDACVIPDGQKWQGMMTLPRELSLCETEEGYRLKTKPFGIDEYRAGAFPIGNQKPLLTESFGLLVQGNFGRIALKNSRGEEVVIEVTVDSITVDRSKSGDLSYFDDVDPKLFKKEDLLVSTTKRYMRGNVNMEIIFDVSYLEIYADGGLETASVCVYPDAPYQVVSTDGDLEVKMYTIKK